MVKDAEGKDCVALNEKGMILLIDDDGKEAPLDALHLRTQIPELRTEAKKHREAKEAFKAKLDKIGAFLSENQVDFESDDSINEFFSKAKTAIDTVANLSEKQVLSAQDVEKLKEQISANFKKQIETLTKTHEKEKGELTGKLSQHESRIYDLLVTSQFATSETVKKKLNFPNAKAAAAYFGNNFKVEEDENGNLIPVGYHKGEKIFTVGKMGIVAPFDEAVLYLAENDPDADSLILAEGRAGSGAQNQNGNQPPSGSLQAQLLAAQKTGDLTTTIAIKRKISAAAQK